MSLFLFDFRRKLSSRPIKVCGTCEESNSTRVSRFVRGPSHVLLLNETATKLLFGKSSLDRDGDVRTFSSAHSLNNYSAYRTTQACPLLVSRASANTPRASSKWSQCSSFSKRPTVVCNWLWSFFRVKPRSMPKWNVSATRWLVWRLNAFKRRMWTRRRHRPCPISAWRSMWNLVEWTTFLFPVFGRSVSFVNRWFSSVLMWHIHRLVIDQNRRLRL